MVLVANRNVGKSRDNDGNIPLDLAMKVTGWATIPNVMPLNENLRQSLEQVTKERVAKLGTCRYLFLRAMSRNGTT
jgi:hypothetical protein